MLRQLLRPAAAAATAATLGCYGCAHAMRIEEDAKLDFKDVLLRPKRSTLVSRSQVDLSRTFKFRHSQRTWTGVPLIVANMDTVGTFEMATTLAKHQAMVAVHKHYTADEWKAFVAAHPDVVPYVAVSAAPRPRTCRSSTTSSSAAPPSRPSASTWRTATPRAS